MRKLSLSVVVAAVALAAGLLPSRTADAKVLITHGDSISHVADIKPEVAADVGPDVAVGYKYSSFGIFFLDLWTWDGEYVLYRGDEFEPVPEAELATLADGALSKPLSYTFPPGLVIILGIIGIWIGWTVYSSRKQARIAELYDDEHYAHALEMLMGEDPAGFDEAVAYLVDTGIPLDEATERLTLLWTGLLGLEQETYAA